MNIQVLVSSMNMTWSKLEKMNIQSNAIIINQTDKKFSYEKKEISGNTIEIYEFAEKGVGKSRNSALMRSSGDIIIMADDDEVFVDNYENIIKKAFIKYPDADMLVFDVTVHEKGEKYSTTTKEGKLNYFNSLKYGTVSFVFRREKIIKNNIYFSLLFGGGAKYGSGEDSLFIWDILKAGLNVYSIPIKIADIYNDDSSWFTGFNEKYFLDKGALFKALGGKWSLVLIVQYWIRKRKDLSKVISSKKILINMIEGSRMYRDL